MQATITTAMAFRSRTGKLIQGWLGRLDKQQPAQPQVAWANRPDNRQPEVDNGDFPSANRFDDDEETNWDDAETLADENNPTVYAQPIVPVVAPLPINTAPDLEEWDEALPAATVKNSNVQEVRRGKKTLPVAQNPEIWDDSLPRRTFVPTGKIDAPSSAQSSQVDAASESLSHRVIGLWTTVLYQLRQILPAPIQQLSDAILTAMVVVVVTVGIWIVDGLAVPSSQPSVASQPAVIGSQPALTESAGSPEQALIEAIGTQLSEITSQYSDDIIQTLRVDRDLLIVELKPSWYQISDDQQDRVTAKMWRQARSNNFSKLAIQDEQHLLIARSPVVGNYPIILRRRQIN